MLLKLEQFLARLSSRKVSGLSEHNRGTCHVELQGPNKDDPIIRFNIWGASDIKDGTIGFR